jgi:hypothetical protein
MSLIARIGWCVVLFGCSRRDRPGGELGPQLAVLLDESRR